MPGGPQPVKQDPAHRYVPNNVGGQPTFRIADICAANKAPATFFVDVYEYTFWGVERMRDLCRRLQDRGFDVQLHTHPGWRNFVGVPLTPVPPDRYEITFTDVPINARVAFRINDQNFCDQNPTGAVIRNVFANDVELVQNTTTPGNGDEPGYALTLAADGAITQ